MRQKREKKIFSSPNYPSKATLPALNLEQEKNLGRIEKIKRKSNFKKPN
jgi:hypothetical protein